MLTGKGIYVWRIKDCEDGNIKNIVTMCQNANFSHVIIKIADGTVGYNYPAEGEFAGIDLAKKLADALKVVDIEPWGFQYIYGQDPVGEAKTANRRVEETGVVGFVINAEGEIKNIANNDEVVHGYFDALDMVGIPWALSSYRYPEVHPRFPWEAFDERLVGKNDFMMPQVYWKEAHDPAEQLRECLRQYAKITDLPILPTGSAYCGGGWCPTDEEIKEFADEAKAQGLPGINFWEWKATRAAGFWKTVRDIDYQTEPPPVNCDEQVAEAVKAVTAEFTEQIVVLEREHQTELAEAIITANNESLNNLINPYLK